MKTEELAEEAAERPLHFDAHEFDGLRDALEKEAEGVFGKIDEFVRDHPWLCIGIATAAGMALAYAARKTSSPTENAPTERARATD